MPITRVNFNNVQQLFKPDRVAQVIRDTETHGTQVLDRFYPPETRQPWDQVLVPVEEIQSITRAVPLVIRGAEGIAIGGDQQTFNYIEPQAVKTKAALAATEYNNARQVSMETVQEWANRKTARTVETHRKTAEALAAESLTGTVQYPIYDTQGNKIGDFTVNYGSLQSFTVSADWTADATKLSTIHQDLSDMRRILERAGYAGNRITVGTAVFGALIDKVQAIGNDTRLTARVTDEGGIRLGQYLIEEFAGQYFDPDGDTYRDSIGANELLMDDRNAPWTHLWVRLDNFKMLNEFGSAVRQSPLGIVTEVSQDGSVINMYAESKPFAIPPVRAMLRTDVTVI